MLPGGAVELVEDPNYPSSVSLRVRTKSHTPDMIVRPGAGYPLRRRRAASQSPGGRIHASPGLIPSENPFHAPQDGIQRRRGPQI